MAEQATAWRMHAHDRNGTFYDLGPRLWVELHGLNFPIVSVDVRLVADDDPAATHWGWIETGADEPSMIWPNWPCYATCFHYGPRAEDEAGRGRTVRLAVTRTRTGTTAMSTVGYIVVEYNQASGMPDLPTGTTLYDTPEEAREEQQYQAEQTAKVGRGERHRVAEVVLLDDEG